MINGEKMKFLILNEKDNVGVVSQAVKELRKTGSIAKDEGGKIVNKAAQSGVNQK